MIWNLPNTLTWLRIFAIPLVVVLFYLPYQLGGSGGGPAVRARRHHRFARRLPGAPHGPDLAARRLPRPGGRQAHRRRGAGAAGQQGHAAHHRARPRRHRRRARHAAPGIGQRHPRAVLHRHHRPRDRHLRAARMDGRDRPARQGQGEPARQVQDHPADRRPVLHVVPLEPADLPGLRRCRCSRSASCSPSSRRRSR